MIDNEEETAKSVLTTIAVNTSDIENIAYQLERIADLMDLVVGRMSHDKDQGFVRTAPLE